jgi:nucleoside-diphosphate-sugar epimerase
MTTLVTGATGNIGRRVVDHLISLGAKDIRALTVNPARAGLPDSVTAITGYQYSLRRRRHHLCPPISESAGYPFADRRTNLVVLPEPRSGVWAFNVRMASIR